MNSLRQSFGMSAMILMATVQLASAKIYAERLDLQSTDNPVIQDTNTAAPESASLAIIGIGLISMVALRNRRR